jgi:CRP/FNR family transcriptional regulator, cyclic AMP receptor protein
MNDYADLQGAGQNLSDSARHFASILDSSGNMPSWGPPQIYPPNTVVYQQDTPATAVYLIERGLVKLTRMESEGQEAIVGLRRRHWLLGAPAVFLESQFVFTVTTLLPCTLRCISSKGFLQLVHTETEFHRQLLKMFSEEIYSNGMKVAELGCIPAKDRLVRFLCELVLEQEQWTETTTSQRPMRLQIPLKFKELAQLIAISPEHLSRLLRELEQRGIITRNKGWLIITDPSALLSSQK